MSEAIPDAIAQQLAEISTQMVESVLEDDVTDTGAGRSQQQGPAVASANASQGLRQAEKSTKPGKAEDANLTRGFVSVLNGKIEELEKSMAGASNQGERDCFKARKKALREVNKYIADKSHSVEDRMTFLQTKYASMAHELIKLEKQYLESQTQLEVVTKERDKAQDTLRKTNQLRDKLEELCRQLTKENKERAEEARRAKEEARRVHEEESNARAEMQARLQTAINDVTTRMDAQQAECTAQQTENDTLRAKLTTAIQQFEQYEALLHKKDLEAQLLQARLEKQVAVTDTTTRRMELLEEANKQLVEANKSAASELEALIEAKKANAVLLGANKDLKDQLDTYYNKFNEFQGTLTKSNQMFDGLKKELENSARLRAALMRERDEIRKRADASDSKLAVALQEQQTLATKVARLQAQATAVQGVDAEEVRRLKAQKETLEGLCRTLTAQLKAAKAAAGSGAAAEEEGAAAPGDVPALIDATPAATTEAVVSPTRSSRSGARGFSMSANGSTGAAGSAESSPLKEEGTTPRSRGSAYGGMLWPPGSPSQAAVNDLQPA